MRTAMLSFICLLLLAIPAFGGDIYQSLDANGTPFFTNDAVRAQRQNAEFWGREEASTGRYRPAGSVNCRQQELVDMAIDALRPGGRPATANYFDSIAEIMAAQQGGAAHESVKRDVQIRRLQDDVDSLKSQVHRNRR